MAPSIKASGSTALTTGVTSTLLDTSDAGTYQLILDIDAIADGDQLEVRIYTKAKSGESYKCLWFALVDHDRGADGAILPSIPTMFPLGAKFDVLQTAAATGRTVVWSVVQAG